MMHFTELPTSALEHVFDFLSFEDMWSIAGTGSSALRSIATQHATDATEYMGDPGENETSMVLWKIRERAAEARAVSQRIWLDVDNYYLIFIGRRTEQPADECGVYMIVNTGEVETLDNGIPFVDATLDLGDVPIVGVCGPMMMDALGRLHLTPQLTVESIIDVPDSHVSDVVAFGSHREHVALVTKSGALMTCGSNNVPVLGYVTPDSNFETRLKRVDALQGTCITQVSCGAEHSLALDAEGEVYSWGYAQSGSLGCARPDLIRWDDWVVVKREVAYADVILDGITHPDDDVVLDAIYDDYYLGLLLPKRIDMECRIECIAAGDRHSMMIACDGRLFACGSNTNGQLGTGDKAKRITPTLIDLDPGVRACYVSCGCLHTCLLTASVANGFAVSTVGANYHGQLGYKSEGSGDRGQFGYESDVTVFTRVEALERHDIVCVCTGLSSSAAVTKDGHIYMWGMIRDIPTNVDRSRPRVFEHHVMKMS